MSCACLLSDADLFLVVVRVVPSPCRGAGSAVALSRPALLFMLGIAADGEGVAKPMPSCVIPRLFFAGTGIV